MRSALRAEWTKINTSPGTRWLGLAIVVATVAVGALASPTAQCITKGCTVDAVKTSLTGVQLGQAVVGILAVLSVGGEYSSGLMRTSLTAVPRRTVLLAAKAVVLGAVVVAAAVVAVGASLVVGRLTGPAFALGAGATARAAGGSVLYLGLIGLLGLGLATAVRDSATAIGLVLGLLYLVPILTPAISSVTWRRHLEQIGPTTAGLAVQTTTRLGGLPIGPWAGLGVLALWAAGALLVGGVLLVVRDA
jgi:ABC-2 type transport system permease protein